MQIMEDEIECVACGSVIDLDTLVVHSDSQAESYLYRVCRECLEAGDDDEYEPS